MKISQQKPTTSGLRHHVNLLASTVLSLLIAGLPLDLSAGQTNRVQLPNIGDPADRFLSPAQEKKLGEDFLRNVYRYGAVLEDPEISSYIQHLGNELSNTLADGTHKFTLFVVKDRSINAFAVPGGYIGVNAGLILSSKSESELASVVAHEIAHVSQRHIARRIAHMSGSQIPTLGAMLAGILLASTGSSDAGTALLMAGVAAQQQKLLNYSRDMEIEADRVGLDLLYRSGFDPRGMPEFFRTLQRKRYSKIPDEYQFLITHPLDSVRIAEAQGRINSLPARSHKSSSYYRYAKARLQALASQNPTTLVKNFEKQQIKNDPYQQYAYSQALERKNLFKRAESVLLPLVNKDKENIVYQLALARTKANANQADEAIKILKRMHNLYPDNFAINYYYAKSLMQDGHAELGEESLKNYLNKYEAPTLEIYKLMAELQELCDQLIESKKTLAEYYYNTGNVSAAVFQLREALRDPKLDVINRSQIEKRLGELLQSVRS